MEHMGNKIAYFRKAKGFSIKMLAENLCDESTIYRLEKGKQLPRIEILNDICMKLEIPLKALFPLNEEVERLKKLCREFSYSEDFLALEITLEECIRIQGSLHSNFLNKEFDKFIKWHQAILLHKKEKRNEDALNLLTDIVKLKNCGSELDISILNSKGLIYLTLNNLEAACDTYKVIYKKIKVQDVVEDLTLMPRVGYNYAYSLNKSKKYKAALNIANEVLYYIETHHLFYLLGEIHHMIGVLSKKEGYLIEAEEAFEKAVLVFTLTKNQSNLDRVKKDLIALR